MYYINMREFRKKKEVPKPSFFSKMKIKITPAIAALALAPVFLFFATVFWFDYSSVSAADSIIAQMVATEDLSSKEHKDKMRELAGASPVKKLRGKVLYETYTFDRTLPLLSPRTAVAVYGGADTVKVVANTSSSMWRSSPPGSSPTAKL